MIATHEGATWTVYKSATGAWRWLALCNWAVVDKEREVVSEQAYQDAIDHAQKTGQYGELDLVHVNGTDVGDCDWLFTTAKQEQPPKLGAGGSWYNTPMATRAREAVQTDPDRWGVSLKFRYDPARKVRGIYMGGVKVLKYTILPQAMAASYGTAIAVKGVDLVGKALDAKTLAALVELGLSEDEIAELEAKALSGSQKSAGDWLTMCKKAGEDAVRVALQQSAVKRQARAYAEAMAATTATGRFLASMRRAVNARAGRPRLL
ncbi:MAG TPA: hypothetical protein VM366_04150 [Anaerolineae bacterium]|nr:hypothetical protein [Anaerolineae bacterium]